MKKEKSILVPKKDAAKKAESKKELDQLTAKLFLDKKNGYTKIGKKEQKKINDFSEGYKDFLNFAKTERESVAYAIQSAEKVGFIPFDSSVTYQAGDKIYINNREKSLILAVIGKKKSTEGVRILASHIDSPRLDLKPIPLYEASELAFFKSHYYGGIKKYQWTAIPLAMHGRVVRKDGTFVDICLGQAPEDPQFCITDLLPHLGRDQLGKTLAKGIEGEELNILVGSQPLCVDDNTGSQLFKLNVMKLIHEKYNITEGDFVSAEIEFVPTFKASDIGFDRSMIGAYGHDDRVCAYTSLQATLESKNMKHTVVTILADKEEVGSDGNTGLNSSYLKYFIEDLAEQDGVEARKVFTLSKCLSADVSAAFDPSFPEPYESSNSCYLNKGLSIMKYTGSGGKYRTSEASAEFTAEIIKVLDDEKVLWQTGELGKIDAGGGGTVAMFIANLNVDVIDAGVPVLSMHSPMEVVSKLDVYMAYKGFKAFIK